VDMVDVEGASHSVRYLPLPDGRRLCLVDGRVIEFNGMKGDSMRLVRAGWSLHQLEVVDPRRLRGAGSTAAAAGGRAEIAAPMPGRVVSVLREAGHDVEAGEGLVVLEAMKMENELRSPITGTVAKLDVKPGQSVGTGQLIAIVEPKTD